MALITVDIADCLASVDPEATLVTYALGSSVVVVAHDPARRMGALLHTMLPASQSVPHPADVKPAMFADTGVPLLLETLARKGCDERELTIKLAGGARRHESRDRFDVGRHNYLTIRKMLWKRGLLVAAEDVGGTSARTVRLEIATGRVLVSSEGREWEL